MTKLQIKSPLAEVPQDGMVPPGKYLAFAARFGQEIRITTEQGKGNDPPLPPLLCLDDSLALKDFGFSAAGELFCTVHLPHSNAGEMAVLVWSQGASYVVDGFSRVAADWLLGGRQLLLRGQGARDDRRSISVLDTKTGSVVEIATIEELASSLGIFDPAFMVRSCPSASTQRTVMVMKDELGQERELMQEKYPLREMSFSPDRSQVAYVYRYPYYKWLQGWRIVTVSLDRQSKSTVFDGLAADLFRLRWGVDGELLSFAYRPVGAPIDRLMDLDRYEAMGGTAPDLFGNECSVLAMNAEGCRRREVLKDAAVFEWVNFNLEFPCLSASRRAGFQKR